VEFFDSAFVVDPVTGFGAQYDKSKRVPFGEYLPLRALLGSFVAAIARGIAPVDVSPGPGPRVVALSIPGEGGDAEVSVGIPICYELLFPDLVRRFAADGAQVLFAITNDAWYGKTGAPHQFLAVTAVRAAESGVFAVRAANTGVSAVIDESGRVLQRTALFERDFLVADVALGNVPASGTFYARHGDLFAWACCLAAALLMLLRAAGRRVETASGEEVDEKAGSPRTRISDG
jgi:apolipoprotein N-acyltransferase